MGKACRQTVQCTVCIKWIHKWCSGDLAGDLVVDEETYGCVKSFCYLGDTLDGDGGADLAATARIRNRWRKFWELLPFLTSRANTPPPPR